MMRVARSASRAFTHNVKWEPIGLVYGGSPSSLTIAPIPSRMSTPAHMRASGSGMGSPTRVCRSGPSDGEKRDVSQSSIVFWSPLRALHKSMIQDLGYERESRVD